VSDLSPLQYTIEQLEAMLEKQEISAEEVAKLSLDQINAVDEDVQAFLIVTEEQAIETARQLDEQQQFDSPLAAIPGEIKDNILTNSIPTTGASKMLENLKDPLYDATVTEKLAQADA